jgi:hypothetical protein
MSKLQEAQAATEKALKELKAAVDNSADPQTLINRVMNYMGSMEDRLGYLQETVQNHRDDMLEHMGEGHLPKAPSRAHMAKAIKNLGWDDEYQAADKKTIYAKTRFGIEV